MTHTKETKESLWEHLKVVEDERNNLLDVNAELLEACKEGLKALKDNTESWEGCYDLDNGIIEQLQQAINKAEGE